MFAHLHCHSPYSFLDGASSLDRMLSRARDLGVDAMAITDHDNVSAAVEFCRLARDYDIKPILGAEITVSGPGHLVLLSLDEDGYENLCRLISRAHLDNPRLEPQVDDDNLRRHRDGIVALSGCRRGLISSLILRRRYREAHEVARNYVSIFGPRSFFLEIQADLIPGNRGLYLRLKELGDSLGVQLLATNNVHHAAKEDFKIHDLLTCIRTRTLLRDVHPQRRLNAENYLKSWDEMVWALGDLDFALYNAGRVAERCRQGLGLGQGSYPQVDLPGGMTAGRFLREQVDRGARERYGEISSALQDRLDRELAVISDLDMAGYFLLVWDVVRYAREKGIRYAGRGSAADSAAAYCLYITEVDSLSRGLLFERFMSRERAEQPDIDIDFDARYRDEVMDYVRRTYGEDRVARVATFSTFRARSAIREMGRAMDFPPDEISRLARTLPHVPADDVERAVREMPEFRGRTYDGKYIDLFRAAASVAGYPRHPGTHLGGIVISNRPLFAFTALQQAAVGGTVCQLDKRGVEDLGLVKLDLLSLRTMSAIDDTVASIKVKDPGFDYDAVALDDPGTFSLISSGNTVGVFQLESPAQRALQQRLNASSLEDVIASMALIRPGPIQGNMVEPYLARREGKEQVAYPHPSLEPILAKTMGVVLFQEQVIEIATAVAGFTPGESDRLRRVMTHARSQREMDDIGQHFMIRARERGVSEDVARDILAQISGYASYGFCEAHAAAFGLHAYKTAYLLHHHPAHFLCSLMNHQPLGYYPLHTLAAECRRRGIKVLPLDVNKSDLQFRVEDRGIRVPVTLVKGLPRTAVKDLVEERQRAGSFRSWPDFRDRVSLKRDALESLILAGAFDAIFPNRRALLWDLLAPGRGDVTAREHIEDLSITERMDCEYKILGLFTSGHPLISLRKSLGDRGFIDSRALSHLREGQEVRVAGIPIRPHRPPTRSGRVVVFLSLEDEWGLVDVTVFEKTYRKYAAVLFGGLPPVLEVRGRMGSRERGLSIIARHLNPYSPGKPGRAGSISRPADIEQVESQKAAVRTGAEPPPPCLPGQ